ncbi:MAG: radical SAM protein, partial [Planctomyces sp.]
MIQWPRAVYLHVPFCLHHCGYCDFTLVARRDHLIPQWFDCLQRELEQQRRESGARLPVDSIFIGGGTPTHLSVLQLQQLAELIAGHFELQPGGEYSMEANPDGREAEKLRVLHEAGVNRLSLGVQSCVFFVVQLLERTHRGVSAGGVVCVAGAILPAVSL